MKERPILFSGPMVRALLDGTKTQTRRVVKLGKITPLSAFERDNIRRFAWCSRVGEGMAIDEPDFLRLCPYGQPGDRLWVRESWAHDAESLEQCRVAFEDAMGGGGYGPYYRATECAPDTLYWRPSIHMPRWASRITLEITRVRVERLHACNEFDAMSEGAQWTPCTYEHPDWTPYRLGYCKLWESINGPGSWKLNPWVWVVEFNVRGAK